MKKFIPLIVVLVLIAGMLVSTYNKVMVLDENVDQAWAQVENTLKRRADLIPNLVNTVKGYAGHEKDVLTEVTNARASMNNANSPEEYAKANEEMNQALKSINVVVEAYPELKADTNFQNLQAELAGTENRIAVERKRYNETVGKYNRAVRRFPTSVMAGMMGFDKRQYFEISEAEGEVPTVNFE